MVLVLKEGLCQGCGTNLVCFRTEFVLKFIPSASKKIYKQVYMQEIMEQSDNQGNCRRIQLVAFKQKCLWSSGLFILGFALLDIYYKH